MHADTQNSFSKYKKNAEKMIRSALKASNYSPKIVNFPTKVVFKPKSC
jgi:hypothetical protein